MFLGFFCGCFNLQANWLEPVADFDLAREVKILPEGQLNVQLMQLSIILSSLKNMMYYRERPNTSSKSQNLHKAEAYINY